MLRSFREFPATLTLCALWVALFGAMLLVQGGLGRDGSLLTGEILHATASRFGDLTLRAVVDGQVWRVVTATFVHFSLLHLAINLFGLYQLGTVLESWYGSAQFLAVYAAIAAFGNGLAVASKSLLGSLFPMVGMFQDHPSGGGSTVLCGLIALLAVVGWRSGTRYGNRVKAEMLGILGFTAVLGVAIPAIDNFGHAGGAVAGAVIGFVHRPMLRNYEGRRRVRVIGTVAVLVLAGAAFAQWQADRTAGPATRPDPDALKRTLTAKMVASHQLRMLAYQYGELAGRYPELARGSLRSGLEPALPEPSAAMLRKRLLENLAALNNLSGDFARGDTAECYRRVRELSARVLVARPYPGEIAEFVRCIRFLNERTTSEIRATVIQLNQIGALAAQ